MAIIETPLIPYRESAPQLWLPLNGYLRKTLTSVVGITDDLCNHIMRASAAQFGHDVKKFTARLVNRWLTEQKIVVRRPVRDSIILRPYITRFEGTTASVALMMRMEELTGGQQIDLFNWVINELGLGKRFTADPMGLCGTIKIDVPVRTLTIKIGERQPQELHVLREEFPQFLSDLDAADMHPEIISER